MVRVVHKYLYEPKKSVPFIYSVIIMVINMIQSTINILLICTFSFKCIIMLITYRAKSCRLFMCLFELNKMDKAVIFNDILQIFAILIWNRT